MVQRLRSADATPETVITALQARGLSADDIELLLQGVPGFRAERRELAEVEAREPPPPRPNANPEDTRAFRRWALYFVITFFADILALAVPWSFPIALPLLLTMFGWEARTGLRRTLLRFAYLVFFVTILPTVLLFLISWHVNQWALINGILFALSIPALVGSANSKSPLKGVADFGNRQVFEHHDVQFTVQQPERVTLAFGDCFDVELCVQNCVDAPREVVVRFAGDVSIVANELEHRFPLEPGYIKRIVVPVRVRALTHKVMSELIVAIGAVGDVAGPRLRLDKGDSYVTPTNEVVQELMGAFQLNSHATVKVKVDTSLPPVETDRAPTVKTVYEPRRVEVEAAART